MEEAVKDTLHLSGAIAGLLLLVATSGLVSACGGGGSSGLPDSGELWVARSESYSPLVVVNAEGCAEPLTWNYVVNGGKPLVLDGAGVSGSVRFDQTLQILFEPVESIRTTLIPFVFVGTTPESSGVGESYGVGNIFEQIDLEGGSARVRSRSTMLTLGSAPGGGGFSAMVSSFLDYCSPLPWVPDRADLGQIVPGTAIGAGEESQCSLSGLVQFEGAGLEPTTTPFTMDTPAPQVWRVLDTLPTLVVCDRVYHDIVVMEIETVVPDLWCPEEDGSASAVRIWFAKGVGIIKAEGLYRIRGVPIDIELLSSNL
jgi:hypothetical protein